MQGLLFGGEIPAFLRTKKSKKAVEVYNDRHLKVFSEDLGVNGRRNQSLFKMNNFFQAVPNILLWSINVFLSAMNFLER